MARGEETSRPKSAIAKKTLTLCASIAFSLLIVEVILRTLDYRPWQPKKLDITVEPAGQLFQVHPILGYTQMPGQFSLTHATGYTWTATHGQDTLRITEPPNSDRGEDSRSEIWIFGCSYTYGWSVNDNETYPWLLQQKVPERKIVNFGVGGYGTINSFLQFREALKTRKKPELIIISYASFHDARNILLRRMGKAVVPYSRAFGSRWRPFARVDGDGNVTIDISELEYWEFPLMRRLALVHLIEQTYNSLEVTFYNSHETSKSLLEEFAALARENDIRFVVAGIDRESARMLEDLAREGIETVDISVDLSRKGNRNMPHDGHPSFNAHRAYSQRLFELMLAAPLGSD